MWLDVKELSSYLRLKEKTIYHLVRQGLIPHYRIGKLIRFKREEIDQWMHSKRARPFEFDKVVSSAVYSLSKGRPGRLGKGGV